ncbi:hypothetical protein [Actinosynnema mirum]|uniref:Uncharacterized protein n=1 Tax=Actinosynnema mirum (strain ATCC 29888 / DSM 43827 / JCM 3225 / NBRC 14064 / NCIMB 13271 / NRRL B-12336 / IMRU 3971 / 101) TaxID=446462 RepID=C6WE01_ACTMD|nr:hypothetical protein [Actinosynnema mirum]ACU34146.1 hypothetical protein Amir_0175 [Actinosynnema mirum DSM 43827]
MNADYRRPFCDPDSQRPWNRPAHASTDPVRAWAEPLLRRAYAAARQQPAGCSHGPIPCVGSREWAALPDTDPRKPAAVVMAALARVEENTPHAIATRVAADWADAQMGRRERAREVAHAPDELGHIIGHLPFCLSERRKLTSELPCAHRGCPRVVRFTHPLPNALAARLPDTSWVRCDAHGGTKRLGVAA